MTAEQHPPVSIDEDVELLREQIEALKQLGRHDVSDGEIYDFSIRWGTALAGRLPRLLHYSGQGLLDETAQREFESLGRELRELSSLAARLGLAEPVLSPEPERTAPRGTRRWRRILHPG